MKTISSFLKSKEEQQFGIIFLRLAFGFHLIHASYPDFFIPSAQREFAGYLHTLGIPFPIIGAYLCHFIEFFGGIAIILGLWVRPIAVALFLNFCVAVFVALPGRPYKEQFQAIQILAISLFFLFQGSGSFSLDRILGIEKPTPE